MDFTQLNRPFSPYSTSIEPDAGLNFCSKLALTKEVSLRSKLSFVKCDLKAGYD